MHWNGRLFALTLASMFSLVSLAWAEGPLSPAEAIKQLKIPDDLAIETVLAEPQIAQPIFFNFDERGRMWVINYLQYPFPAGLKILSEDKFLRAVYDKVPPPPPNHFRGLDKITIHEDTDGDGSFDKHKTFVEGLNIASACVKGRGGVWVLNPPYLLFYPDKNDDDVPDGDPVVHLEGFGMEDTHSVVNSIQWGPDGWLYAAQGSTVSGAVKRPTLDKTPVHSMGQLIWRYHPETRRYEIFAEGGGNAFGVEIDSKGRLFSGHNGGDTRGFHYVQGGYLQKGFSKHGPLSNPYSFGYFPAMKHPQVPRFSHNFVINEGAALPDVYAGKMFAIMPLQSQVTLTDMMPDTSSFQTKDNGFSITSKDPWFRPVDIKIGPDGAVYVADMYEGQIAHLRHHEGKIDKSNGRIYRLKAKSGEAIKPFDLGKKSSAELVELLSHPNKWQRRMAIQLLGDRKDASVRVPLAKLIDTQKGPLALEALWALYVSGGFNEAVAERALKHDDPFVRAWTVRLLCDDKQVSSTIATQLVGMAESEPDVAVRSQLASSAKRLPAESGLPIVRKLLAHSEDAGDIHVPLLLWWAIESKAISNRDAVIGLFDDPAIWKLPIVQTAILSRVMRRYASSGARQDLLTCAQLFRMSPDEASSKQLMRGFEEAFQGRSLARLPVELAEQLSKVGGGSLILGLRQGKAEAVEKALAAIDDSKVDADQRLMYVQIFGEVKQPSCVPALLKLVSGSADDRLRMAALTSLQIYDDAAIAKAVLDQYPKFTEDSRSVAQTLLVSRKPWAMQLLDAVESKKIDPTTIPLDVVRKLTIHRDDRIAKLVAAHWGAVEGATTAEMQKQIEQLVSVVRSNSGSPYAGKKIFNTTCGKCHRLFGQGGEIGPDLTTYKRDDFNNILVNVVNPSAEIREGFENFLIVTSDGRTISGFLVDKDNQVLSLRGLDGQTVTIAHDDVEEMVPQKKSLMPEGLLKEMTSQQVSDLFAYLRSTQPLND